MIVRKRIWQGSLLGFLALVVVFPILGVRNRAFSSVYRRHAEETVLVYAEGSKDGKWRANRGHGSGVAVSSHLILTAGHVARVAGSFLIRTTTDEYIHGTPLFIDNEHDLALILADKPLKQYGVYTTNYYRGEPVMAVGCPEDFLWTATVGAIAGEDGPFLLTDVAVSHGSSGGPLYNLQGKIVGIVSRSYYDTDGPTGFSGMVKPQYIAQIVEAWL